MFATDGAAVCWLQYLRCSGAFLVGLTAMLKALVHNRNRLLTSQHCRALLMLNCVLLLFAALVLSCHTSVYVLSCSVLLN